MTRSGAAPRGPLVALCLALGQRPVAAAVSDARASLIRGVSYGPVPLKSIEGASQLPEDDWFCNEAVAMWGRAGRGDLRVIRSLGANFVRLYGNNPNNDHTNFLDEARFLGLSVAAGLSDYPYFQHPGSCKASSEYNCFSQVMPLYLMNLRNGFLTPEGEYHPALKYMNILNEPDLKMPATATTGDRDGPIQMVRAIISGFDAMLEAEKVAGVRGPLVNITATFSYAVCSACERFPDKPALGQIAALDDGMRNPEKYGYKPKNDITAAYVARFTHSFNTQNPATDLQVQFMNDYSATFPGMPVYIGEYHRVPANQTEDLDTILGIAEVHPLFLGISFFEYQVAYWKTGSEMDFGMFALGDYVVANLSYFSHDYKVWCLKPLDHPPSGMTKSDAVALAYGGSPVDPALLCQPNPLGVPLSQEGFLAVKAQRSPSQMALFMERVVSHMGAVFVNSAGLEDALASLSRKYVEQSNLDFSDLASYLGSGPGYLSFDPNARCIARRSVDPTAIAPAIDWACHKATSFSCAAIPAQCDNNTYRIADYIFSRYYRELGSAASPLEHCDFGGAAVYAPRQVYGAFTGSAACLPDVEALPTTSRSPDSSGGARGGGGGAPSSGGATSGGGAGGGGSAFGGGSISGGGRSSVPSTSRAGPFRTTFGLRVPAFDLPETGAATTHRASAALLVAAVFAMFAEARRRGSAAGRLGVSVGTY
eukprot:CAMPEP_0176075604 /NCGR_PEP_ID=MMETSP0120_2-20121206/37789_1 /TAXON_ID=160619 /ORGANISM="Kryptoperidinium foliaceum, Strain CCMP 1326" /LENGTH=707 /DNA_ID=CAMNT_0017409311 /DNA_START=50 /DNA_END=2171 /DNA_ORIENTATION=+